MDDGLELRIQPQVWVNDRAVDAGEPFAGNVEDVLIAMGGADFRQTAQEIFDGRGDLEILVMNSGLADSWLTGARDRTYRAGVWDVVFEEWLERHGLDRDRALQMTDDDMVALRTSAAASALVP